MKLGIVCNLFFHPTDRFHADNKKTKTNKKNSIEQRMRFRSIIKHSTVNNTSCNSFHYYGVVWTAARHVLHTSGLENVNHLLH